MRKAIRIKIESEAEFRAFKSTVESKYEQRYSNEYPPKPLGIFCSLHTCFEPDRPDRVTITPTDETISALDNIKVDPSAF